MILYLFTIIMDDSFESRAKRISYPSIIFILKEYLPELITELSGTKKTNYVNMKLFEEAFAHESAQYEIDGKVVTYERLEYLGDAVFHLIITEYLYKRYEEEAEGFLTRLRIKIERGNSMVEITEKLKLGNFVQLGRININEHILEDIFEAFIGAFYINFGVSWTRKFIVNILEKCKDLPSLILYDDNYKDTLLRYFHKMKWGHPIYEEKRNINGKKFTSIVKDPFGEKIGIASSNSKLEAEQAASLMILENAGIVTDGIVDEAWFLAGDIEEPKQKELKKSTLSVFNQSNKAMKAVDIREILGKYNIAIPTGHKLTLSLFSEAMTHRSYIRRKKLSPEDKIAKLTAVPLQKKSNERLQFLGDAVIHLIIGEYLFYKYKQSDEGFLTRLRCKLENKDSLFHLSKLCGISDYLLISQVIEVIHGRNNVNIIGGGFESFIGALYLEFGLLIPKQFVLEIIRIELNIEAIADEETNYKDVIIKLYREQHWGDPDYRIIKQEGPDHAKIFTIGLYLNGELMGIGKASSKKKAEQIASKKVYFHCKKHIS